MARFLEAFFQIAFYLFIGLFYITTLAMFTLGVILLILVFI